MAMNTANLTAGISRALAAVCPVPVYFFEAEFENEPRPYAVWKYVDDSLNLDLYFAPGSDDVRGMIDVSVVTDTAKGQAANRQICDTILAGLHRQAFTATGYANLQMRCHRPLTNLNNTPHQVTIGTVRFFLMGTVAN